MVIDSYFTQEVPDSYGTAWLLLHTHDIPRRPGRHFDRKRCPACRIRVKIGVLATSIFGGDEQWQCCKCFLKKVEGRKRVTPVFRRFVEAIRSHCVAKEIFGEGV